MHLFGKSALFALFPLWAPKSHANPSTKQRAGGVVIKTANFLLQSALWEHLGHTGSQLGPGLAGWLRRGLRQGARAEARARAEAKAMAEARARAEAEGEAMDSHGLR